MTDATPRPAATYFVYGTLRPGGRYWPNIAPLVDRYEPACLFGFKLWHLPEGYPAIEEGDGRVFGDLIVARAGSESKLREVMDAIEDCRPDDPDSLFDRIRVYAHPLRDLQRRVEAELYVYALRHSEHLHAHGKRVGSGDWREYIATANSEAEDLEDEELLDNGRGEP